MTNDRSDLKIHVKSLSNFLDSGSERLEITVDLFFFLMLRNSCFYKEFELKIRVRGSAIIYDFSKNVIICVTRPDWVFLLEQWPGNHSSTYRGKEVNIKYNSIK
jgi:hypothetical protein